MPYHCPVSFDASADAAYVTIAPEIPPGSVVRQIEIRGVRGGMLFLDLNADGQVMGLEIIGARGCLDPTILDHAGEPGADRSITS